MPFFPIFKFSFTPDTPPPMLVLWVTFSPPDAAANDTGVGSERSGFSVVLNSFPLFLCWSSIGCRHCSTCVSMEKLPLTWPCFSLVLSSIPLSSACPEFLPILKHTFPEVPPCYLSDSAVPWGWSWQEPALSENREEQNIVIFFLGVMSKSVIFKIHLVSVSFWMWRISNKLQWNLQWLLQAAKRLMWPNHDDQASAVPVFSYSLLRRASHLTVCAGTGPGLACIWLSWKTSSVNYDCLHHTHYLCKHILTKDISNVCELIYVMFWFMDLVQRLSFLVLKYFGLQKVI